jgi:hypothetical protein
VRGSTAQRLPAGRRSAIDHARQHHVEWAHFISSCDIVGCAPLRAAWKAPIAELEGANSVTALPVAVSVGICVLTLPARGEPYRDC